MNNREANNPVKRAGKPARIKLRVLASSILILLFTVVLLRNAWLSDDAYITFRTIDNLVNGYGLTWNTAEKVQTYTHPLWMFLLAALYFFTGETYYTSILLSVTISLCAVLLFAFGIAGNIRAALLGLGIMVLSKTFVDYSTSGLENPLTHLLLLVFIYLYLNSKKDIRSFFLLSLVTSLGLLNRLDTGFLFLPPLFFFGLGLADRRKAAVAAIAAFLPLFFGEAFSLFYYGFLFPNTAYAKLNTGIADSKLVVQSFYYLLDSLVTDHLALPLIIAVVAVALASRNKQSYPLVLGIVLYLIYILKIGGDFMSGRFIAAPLVCSLAVLARLNRLYSSDLKYAVAWLFVLFLGFTSTHAPLLSGSGYGSGDSSSGFGYSKGITDERAFYYQMTGLLLKAKKGTSMPAGEWVDWGRDFRKKKDKFTIKTAIGMVGYFAGPGLYILDPMALADPLLARLPVPDRNRWRIGHFERRIPTGYMKTLRTGKNCIKNKELALYYDKLCLLTRGETFNVFRLREILNFALGKYTRLLDSYQKNQDMKLVGGVYLDSSEKSFDYICRCLDYDSLDLPDSSLICHAAMIRSGIEESEEDRYYWGEAMRPFYKRFTDRVRQRSASYRDMLFQLHYYSIWDYRDALGKIYGSFLYGSNTCQDWMLLAEAITAFGHQSILQKSAEKELQGTKNPAIIFQIYVNLAMINDLNGSSEQASLIFVRMRRSGLKLAEAQKEEWLKAMTLLAERYKSPDAAQTRKEAYLHFLLRYFWLKEDNTNLKKTINIIFQSDLTPDELNLILEVASVLDHPEWIMKIKAKAGSQHPEY